MSVLTDLIYGGSGAVAGLAENAVKTAIEKYGEKKKIAFPDTAYFLPTIYAAVGVKVAALGDLPACLNVLKSLISNKDDLGEALNAGLATAIGAEILEALKYVHNDDPYGNEKGIGFVPDSAIRSLGVPLVTGDIPGVAVVLGKAGDAETAAGIIRDYQSKGLLSFLVGEVIDQAAQNGVRMGLEFRVVPLGRDATAVIHAVTVAVRAALIFGNIQAGDLKGLLDYTKERVPAFVNTFGEINSVVVSAGAGAIALGFPVITDVDLGENQVPGALESVTDHGQTVKRSLELRNIRIKVKQIPIPVSYASAFEGEIIRKGDTNTEIASNRNPTCELVIGRGADEVEDHKIIIDGPDIEESPDEIQYLPLANIIEVYGSKMQPDFESVIERKIHTWLNYMEGVMHTGQRNLLRIRLSREAVSKGLRLKHLGEMLYYMILDEFGSVVDKCQITMVTDGEKVQKLLEELAMPAYKARDERITSLSDESVDTFYTCILCQSFAPSHCCIVTPERLGLCGAVSWLDAKATVELTPNGPSRPIPKEGLIDEKYGKYNSVNKVIKQETHGAVDEIALYSILEQPMTSCGCFECICGIMPEANGVIIVNREYRGMAPNGMTFGELASMTGGGVQTPGFMGHGRQFISSKKFAAAEGGPARIVWMTKELKDYIGEKLNKTAKELYGIDNFTDMVCDETIAVDVDEVMNFLNEKGHPALSMSEII